MILNLLRVEALKVEEMIKRSFSEHATQSLLPDQQKQVAATEESLKKFAHNPCDYCNSDLGALHSASMEYISQGTEMLVRAMMTSVGRKIVMTTGRVIVHHKEV